MREFIERSLRQCGEILLELYSGGGSPGTWEGDQFKAPADRVAHDFLCQRIQSSFPGILVVSEEDDGSIEQESREYFLIDPIDGTASFAHGFPGWVTQMAYVKSEIPVLSGVFAPVSDEYFEAERNHGARCNGRALAVCSSSDKIKSIIDNYPEARGITRELMNALDIHTYAESGSIALKICRIADNSADLFFKAMAPRDWDLAPPKLILEEAAGILRDANGEEIRFGRKARRHHGLIATKNAAMLETISSWYRSRK